MNSGNMVCQFGLHCVGVDERKLMKSTGALLGQFMPLPATCELNIPHETLPSHLCAPFSICWGSKQGRASFILFPFQRHWPWWTRCLFQMPQTCLPPSHISRVVISRVTDFLSLVPCGLALFSSTRPSQSIGCIAEATAASQQRFNSRLEWYQILICITQHEFPPWRLLCTFQSSQCSLITHFLMNAPFLRCSCSLKCS